MKKNLFKSTLIAFSLLLSTAMIAQDTVTVTPGLGTLDAAIALDGGAKVYKLTAGGWYGLESIIEVNDTTMKGVDVGLTIIGEETSGLPATVQVGVDGAGSVNAWLFRIFNNLTLKNVFLSAQDISGVTGAGVIEFADSVVVVMDNCVIDPAGVNRTFGGGVPANGSKFFMTNNQIFNNGHMQGPNDGGWMGSMAWDTLWVENNTFVSSGQDFIGTTFHNVPNNNFIWINHNTFLWHDVWIKKSYNDQNFFFTNNLMHDISIFAQLYAWGQFFPDYKQGNTMLSLTCIDTLEVGDGVETLPSDRKVFWEYNLQYNSPELRSLPQLAKDGGHAPLYLIPMLWDDDTPAAYTAGLDVVSPADSSRENRILADKTNWPYMFYNNNMYDIDPEYNEDQIYATNDSMIANISSWYGANIWGNGATFDGTPSYNWEVDKWAGTPNNEFPTVWPRFDGSYTSTALMTASIEKLPLGDLNWFPAKKAMWMAEQDLIEAHILAQNESQYTITVGVDQVSTPAAKFSIYPNPAKDQLHIDSDTELAGAFIHDITGKLVKEVVLDGDLSRALDISDLNNGVYILEVKTLKGESFSSKVIKN